MMTFFSPVGICVVDLLICHILLRPFPVNVTVAMIIRINFLIVICAMAAFVQSGRTGGTR